MEPELLWPAQPPLLKKPVAAADLALIRADFSLWDRKSESLLGSGFTGLAPRVCVQHQTGVAD